MAFGIPLENHTPRRPLLQASVRVVLQVLLRWATQRGRTVMPKSVTPERIRENFHLDFEIPDHLMAVLDGLSSRVCQKYAWNPENVL